MPRVLPQPIGPKYIRAFSTMICLSFFASPCFAESTATSEWNIAADKITRFENPNSIIAEGNIVLTKQEKQPPQSVKKDSTTTGWADLLEETNTVEETTPEELPQDQTPQFVTKVVIKADWIAYDIEKQSIRARGNVSIVDAADQVFADEVQMDLQKEIGSFSDAKILRSQNDLHIEGKKIEKTGLKTYRIEDGWVITCEVQEGETPPWSFSSSETTIEQGGYAVLRNARFNIKDVPVFYTPYFIIPVKDTRQTGLLFPQFSHSSRDGFGTNIPLFVNLSDSTDLTFFPEFHSKRGFMPGLEFRYVQSPVNKGTFMGSFLDDKLSDPAETAYYADTGFTHTNSERYWLRGKADHDFGDSWIARMDIDVVSDRDYLTEFSSGLTGFSNSQASFLDTYGRGFENEDTDQRKNTLKLLKSWSGMALNIDFLAINDVRTIETSPTPLWKLPSVDYSGARTIADSKITFDWDADYVNYWREDGVGGHRVDLFPRLSTPLPLGPYLETQAEVGLRETVYSVTTHGDGEWTMDESPSRFLYTIHTDVATTLARNYDLQSDTYSKISHTIRPYIKYDFIPEEDQKDLPEFDAVDFIEDANKITYGLDTFFDLYDKENNGISQVARQYSYLKLYQSYDLRSAYSDQPISPVTVKLGWLPMDFLTIAYKAEIPIESSDYTIHGLGTAYTNSRGDLFSFDYRYNELEDVEQLNGYFKVQLLSNVLSEFSFEHSLSESETNESTLALTYQALCWSVMLKTQYTPTDDRIMLVFNLANIGAPLGVSL